MAERLFCDKCNSFKDGFVYANRFNSTKFCSECGTSLEYKEFREVNQEDETGSIWQAITNAIMRL